MTPNEYLLLEQKRIELDKGYYLTPARVAILTRTSNEIMKKLATATVPALLFAECRYVLDITRTAIDLACKEKAPPDGDAPDEAKAK